MVLRIGLKFLYLKTSVQGLSALMFVKYFAKVEYTAVD